MSRPELSVVIVSYRCADLLDELIKTRGMPVQWLDGVFEIGLVRRVDEVRAPDRKSVV